MKEVIEKLKDAICELVNLAEDADISREVFEMLDNAGADIIDCLDELEGYHAIGTAEEFKALKAENAELHNEAQAERALLDKRDAEVRAKAIDEAIEASAKAICVGCGYLDGYKCTYKGGNCGVSKPMLESVVKALEQMKGGAT